MLLRGFLFTLAFGLTMFFGTSAMAASAPASVAAFKDAVAEALAAEGAPARLQVTLAGNIRAAEDPAILVTAYEPETGRFRADFTAEDGTRRTLHGKAEALVSVPVLARDIAMGEVIRAEDVTFRDMAASRVQRSFVTDTAALEGFAARRAMRAGDAVRMGDVQRPLIVKKGDLVTIVFEADGISLSARGRAMANGALGDVIQVVNVQSHRTIDAAVTGTGRVAVSILSSSDFTVLSSNAN